MRSPAPAPGRWPPTSTARSPGRGQRPGLCRLLADAPWAFDLVVVDGYPQLASDRSDLQTLLGQLASAGVRTVVVPPSPGRRAARLVGNLVLADLVAGAVR